MQKMDAGVRVRLCYSDIFIYTFVSIYRAAWLIREARCLPVTATRTFPLTEHHFMSLCKLSLVATFSHGILLNPWHV